MTTGMRLKNDKRLRDKRKYRLPLAPRSLPLNSADCVVTSPPFQDQEPWQDKEWNHHGKGPVRETQPSAAGYTRKP